MPVVNADEGVRSRVVVPVPFVQPAEFAFKVVTLIVLIMPVLVEFVLKICRPGLSSILGFPALDAILLKLIVGNVDCATK